MNNAQAQRIYARIDQLTVPGTYVAGRAMDLVHQISDAFENLTDNRAALLAIHIAELIADANSKETP